MSDAKFGSWSVAESPVTIEYSLVVIEEIRQQVAEGFQMLARGGMEVGGVLYGTRDGRKLSILANRPIACEHARGPAFLLSEKDREALKEQLAREAEDPRLDGLICLGWFLSHTRSDIMLSESDLDIYAEFFSAPWQIAMVVRPGRGGAMRAGFFVREPDGLIKADRSYEEFNFPDRLAGVLGVQPRGERPERRMGLYPREPREEMPEAPFGPGETDAPGALHPGLLHREGYAPAAMQPGSMPPGSMEVADFLPSPPPNRKWPWMVLWAVVVMALAVAGFRYFLSSPAVDPIGLSVAEKDGQLQIQWNHVAKPVVNAGHGTLTIVDGKDSRTVPMSRQELETGKYTYQRTTGDVEVRLMVEDASGQKTEEASQFLGRPPVTADSEELQMLREQRDQLQAEIQRLQRQNSEQAQRIQELNNTLRILQARLGIK